MRIVTRPDFDGIVCAVLLFEALGPKLSPDILWLEPSDVQAGTPDIREGDILANLPWHPATALWFDHHVSNRPQAPVPGAFDIAPSAAGLIYAYYRARGDLDNRFDELVQHTDDIDSANLTLEQVRSPEDHPYLILSMTIQNHGPEEAPYWNRLVRLLRTMPITDILADPEVDARCQKAIRENQAFAGFLKAYTTIEARISVTDFRSLDPVPSGNRFLTYSLFPDTIASVKIRYKDAQKRHVLVSVGQSIFTPGCRVNVGTLLSGFGGGGHAGAGGCTLAAEEAQEKIGRILAVLRANTPLN